MIKYINTWKLKRWQSKLLTRILSIMYPAKIQKGDTVRCHGIGYPHWKGMEFTCEVDFKDGSIGLNNMIRVQKDDFRKINKQ